MDILGNQIRSTDLRFLPWLVLTAEVFGITSVVLVGVWMGHFEGGFNWTGNAGEIFNYHPLFMVLGILFLNSNAILVYRVFRNNKKIYIKILHASLHIFALVASIVGLTAVFKFHKTAKLPHLYSIHSWLGMITIVLFGLQWICGFLTYLFPKAGMAVRAMVMPFHQFFGLVILVFAGATTLMGVLQKCIFSIGNYKELPVEAYVANFLGLMTVGLVTTVIYIVTRTEYKRPSTAEEDDLPLQENQ